MTDLGLRLYYIYNQQETPTQPGLKVVYLIDFNYISQLIPIGVERFDVAGDSRKTIQQTIGIYDQNKESYSDNFYVDTWANSPDKIVLSGTVKMPEAVEQPIISARTTNTLGSNKTGIFGTLLNVLTLNTNSKAPQSMSFIGALEQFYKWNSLASRVHGGDSLILFDFLKQQMFTVTIASKRYSMTVDKPMLIPWEISLTVIDQTDMSTIK